MTELTNLKLTILENKMLTYSIGEMVDKLCVIHLKVWHLEEQIQKAEEDSLDAKEIEKLCDKVVNLNAYRMKIVKSIARSLDL